MLSFIISNLLIVPSLMTGSVCPSTAAIVHETEKVEPQTIIVAGDFKQDVSRDEITTAVSLGNGKYFSASNISMDGVVNTALSLQGVPYVMNASDPSIGFDCSGFTMYVYGLNGVNLPHSSTAQGSLGTPVSEANAQPGDLLIWPGHVGIWLSPGTMIDSAVPGTVVQVRPIWGNPQIVHLG